ncbi:hypothetical protein JKP88DRAFT_289528 [Tribonema minus]|uniref:Uncharacterized protein n=1 Tax=Tribonema minus TaxID=303371 RepID=A0A836CGV9_9STRA|nr:hypothetical protein JKP88DRAFT_289528 [Tribonema minus]
MDIPQWSGFIVALYYHLRENHNDLRRPRSEPGSFGDAELFSQKVQALAEQMSIAEAVAVVPSHTHKVGLYKIVSSGGQDVYQLHTLHLPSKGHDISDFHVVGGVLGHIEAYSFAVYVKTRPSETDAADVLHFLRRQVGDILPRGFVAFNSFHVKVTPDAIRSYPWPVLVNKLVDPETFGPQGVSSYQQVPSTKFKGPDFTSDNLVLMRRLAAERLASQRAGLLDVTESRICGGSDLALARFQRAIKHGVTSAVDSLTEVFDSQVQEAVAEFTSLRLQDVQAKQAALEAQRRLREGGSRLRRLEVRMEETTRASDAVQNGMSTKGAQIERAAGLRALDVHIRNTVDDSAGIGAVDDDSGDGAAAAEQLVADVGFIARMNTVADSINACNGVTRGEEDLVRCMCKLRVTEA